MVTSFRLIRLDDLASAIAAVETVFACSLAYDLVGFEGAADSGDCEVQRPPKPWERLLAYSRKLEQPSWAHEVFPSHMLSTFNPQESSGDEEEDGVLLPRYRTTTR